jgi:LPXTG-motif cell wall-anchored protein
LLLALVAAVIAGPAAAIAVAGNGPSAGDNQYTDPLSTSTTTHSTPPPAASTTPAAPPAHATATAPTTAPTATLASSTTSAASGSSSKTLPMTGYDGLAGALLGAGLLGAGLAVRRRVRPL